MKVLKITSKDVKDGKYIGKTDVSNYDGHIEIEGNLGWVKFEGDIIATGHIWAEAGSGIKAGDGIEAGYGIEAGGGIEAGYGITCKLTLQFAYKLFAGTTQWLEDNTEYRKVICGKLDGEVAYGDVEETGLPDTDSRMIEIKGKKWSEETIAEALKNHAN